MKSNFELADIFSDNIVFQAGLPIKIFGKCKKNIEIQIDFLGQQFNIKTKDESFLVELPAIEERKSSFSFTIKSKKQEQTIYNCQIGDVYLFIGGMNVSMPLEEGFYNQEYDMLDLRFFSCDASSYSWKIADKTNYTSFSAVAYLFAKNIHNISQSAIGIINCTSPNSRIFSWMNISDIRSNKEIKQITDKYSSSDRIPLYSVMKEKIIPHQIKSVIIYQGENDYPYYNVFENCLKLIIKCLRLDFNCLTLPFFVIQIAGYNHPDADDFSVSMIRIAQAKVASVKDSVYLVSAIDIGSENDIFPKDKHLLAKRLADTVLEKLYRIGKNNISPSFFSHTVYPNKVTILIKDNYLNLVSRSGQHLGFSYTENGVDFKSLKSVSIANNIIEINLDKDAKEIRYAMKKYPTCDIFSSNGLPLLPFRVKL
mgnify:CR=1 FL=1